MSSLTKQQQTTLIYIAGFVLSLGLVGGMLYNLSSARAAVTRQKQDVERKENQANAIKPATVQEQNRWTEQPAQVTNLLLSEQAVPQFFEEVTKIATETGIQRLGVNTEEISIDPAKASSAEEARAVAVGIRRYLSVTMKFQGQYADIASFLGGVAKLERPIEYHLVALKRTFPLIEVQLVMYVYKREPA
jgi:Tfp pilus assembly protein PilO